jgi:hypothetical protein
VTPLGEPVTEDVRYRVLGLGSDRPGAARETVADRPEAGGAW